MSIAKFWQSSMLERSILVLGCAQVVTVQYHGGILGILNVYAPNHASARAEFWSRIASSLLRANCWCMGGDFNMLESLDDRVGGSQTSVHDRELAAWELLCMTMRILDAWSHEGFARAAGSLCFSRSDRRLGGTNLSRLDRFYIRYSVGERGGTMGILASTTFSDHAPVVLVLEDQRRPAGTQLRIPEVVVTDACLCGEIKEIWRLRGRSLIPQSSVRRG